ncbi:hypothetical protein AB0L06_41995 [Spirillospora sp. NPDC052269]
MDKSGFLLDLLFETFDQLLGVLWAIESELQSAYDAASRDGTARAGEVRPALDDAMVNLNSSADTLGGAQRLLGHARNALDRLVTDDVPDGRHDKAGGNR